MISAPWSGYVHDVLLLTREVPQHNMTTFLMIPEIHKRRMGARRHPVPRATLHRLVSFVPRLDGPSVVYPGWMPCRILVSKFYSG